MIYRVVFKEWFHYLTSTFLILSRNPFTSAPEEAEAVMWDESDEYNTSHGRCGVAVVIINETFRGHKSRTGSQLDANNLCRTFSLLGFEVRLITDCTLKELKHVLETGQNQIERFTHIWLFLCYFVFLSVCFSVHVV